MDRTHCLGSIFLAEHDGMEKIYTFIALMKLMTMNIVIYNSVYIVKDIA